MTFKSAPYLYTNAFNDCSALSDVYLCGTKDDWNEIRMLADDGNAGSVIATCSGSGATATAVVPPNVLITQLVDEEVCNPLKIWHDLGEHANPSADEVALLRSAANPFVQTKRCGNKINLTLKENAVCYFEIKTAPIISDRGYEYGRLE